MIKTQVANKAQVKAQAQDPRREALENAKAQLRSFSNVGEAKEACRAAVASANSGRAEAIRAARASASGSQATAASAPAATA